MLNVQPAALAAERTPNILLILADDLGYGDVGAFNPESKIATPHIDALAQQGLRLTDAHAAPLCIPTRYELLTGRYLFRSQRRYSREGLIDPGRLTIASLLKQAGYTTAMIGKWHLSFAGGAEFDYSKPLRGGPVDHGFDTFYGIHASLDISPYFYIENDRTVQAPTEHIDEHHSSGWRSIQAEYWRGGAIAPGFKHEEVLPRLTDRAVRYLNSRAQSTEPFFLYFALPAPHAPWLPRRGLRGKSGAGMYGDYVMEVDEVVGRVLGALQEAGKANDTLVIFSSDNGPNWFPADVRRYGHRAAGGWRGMKGDFWEGGQRMPFIARWPGRIAAGRSSAQLFSLVDILATFASLTGQKLPNGVGEDSFDQLPAILNTSTSAARRSILYDSNWPATLVAIRERDWKLIPWPEASSYFETADEHGEFHVSMPFVPRAGEPTGQLYNLMEDPAEQHNLYTQHPDIVVRLSKLLAQYRSDGRTRPQ